MLKGAIKLLLAGIGGFAVLVGIFFFLEAPEELRLSGILIIVFGASLLIFGLSSYEYWAPTRTTIAYKAAADFLKK